MNPGKDKKKITIAPFILDIAGYSTIIKNALEKKGFYFLPTNTPLFYKFRDYPKADIVHFQWLHNQYSSGILITAVYRTLYFLYRLVQLKQKGLSFCWTMHNMRPHENRRPWIDFVNYFMMSKIADAIVVLSEWQKKRAIEKYHIEAKKIFVIPHGNYIGYNTNTCSQEEARDILNIEKEKFVYLFFGQIREYKGVPDLIQSFKSMHQENDLLVITGRILYSYHFDTSALNHPSIRSFLKWIPEEDIQYFFNAADVCVFPFKRITNSGAVLLAMSFGKPVVCPRKGSCQEIVNSDFGILYENGHLNEALRQIKKKNTAQMGEMAYQEAKKYDWDHVADRYADVFEFVLKNKK